MAPVALHVGPGQQGLEIVVVAVAARPPDGILHAAWEARRAHGLRRYRSEGVGRGFDAVLLMPRIAPMLGATMRITCRSAGT